MFGVSGVTIYGKAFIMRSVSDYRKSGKFHTMSEHSGDRCSCSSLYMILCIECGLVLRLLFYAIDNYINSTAWVLRCLFNIVGYSRTSCSGTGKCQVPRIFINSFTINNLLNLPTPRTYRQPKNKQL